MKKVFKFFSLPISLRITLKLSLRSRFSAKKYFFVFCRKFGFDVEKMSNHYSQLKKQVKVDSETRSYDFLTETREKNPMSRNITDLGTTSEYAMICPQLKTFLSVYIDFRQGYYFAKNLWQLGFLTSYISQLPPKSIWKCLCT